MKMAREEWRSLNWEPKLTCLRSHTWRHRLPKVSPPFFSINVRIFTVSSFMCTSSSIQMLSPFCGGLWPPPHLSPCWQRNRTEVVLLTWSQGKPKEASRCWLRDLPTFLTAKMPQKLTFAVQDRSLVHRGQARQAKHSKGLQRTCVWWTTSAWI